MRNTKNTKVLFNEQKAVALSVTSNNNIKFVLFKYEDGKYY